MNEVCIKLKNTFNPVVSIARVRAKKVNITDLANLDTFKATDGAETDLGPNQVKPSITLLYGEALLIWTIVSVRDNQTGVDVEHFYKGALKIPTGLNKEFSKFPLRIALFNRKFENDEETTIKWILINDDYAIDKLGVESGNPINININVGDDNQ